MVVMRLLLLCMTVIGASGLSFGQYSEEVRTWPEVRLKLSSDVIVRDLFAAGLHPYWKPNAENKSLFAKHAVVTLVDRNGRVFPPFPSDIVRTIVQRPDLIETMDLWSPPLTVEEARSEMTKWLPLIGKTEKELQAFLDAVRADWLHYDISNGSSDVIRFVESWTDQDGLKTTVLLMKSWQWQVPLRMCLKIETAGMVSRKRWLYNEGPIPPPPGFEGADMKAPKHWEADNPFIPLTIQYRAPQGTLPPNYEALNSKVQSEPAVPMSEKGPEAPALKKVPMVELLQASYQTKMSGSWTLTLGLMAIATGLFWWLIKRGK